MYTEVTEKALQPCLGIHEGYLRSSKDYVRPAVIKAIISASACFLAVIF